MTRGDGPLVSIPAEGERDAPPSGAAQVVILTEASMRRGGIDPVTAFLATSTASGDFAIVSTEEQAPQVICDESGREVGRAQVLGGTASLSGSPIAILASGAAFGGLACAAFAVAARMCGAIRGTGVARVCARAPAGRSGRASAPTTRRQRGNP